MKKLLALITFAFALAIFVPATQAGTINTVNVQKAHHKHHQQGKHHSHHQKHAKPHGRDAV